MRAVLRSDLSKVRPLSPPPPKISDIFNLMEEDNSNQLSKPKNTRQYLSQRKINIFLIFVILLLSITNYISYEAARLMRGKFIYQRLENVRLKDENYLLRTELDAKQESAKSDNYIDFFSDTCINPVDSNNSYLSKDETFLLVYKNETATICKRDTDGKYISTSTESLIENNNWLISATYWEETLLFLNKQYNTLDYISFDNIPNKEKYLRSSGEYKLFFFGPNDNSMFSPNGDKVIFGASSCHDCATNIYYYSLNLTTGQITEIGYAHKDSISWFNNNQVSFEEYTWRNSTEQDYKDGYDYPIVYEELGTKTIFVN